MPTISEENYKMGKQHDSLHCAKISQIYQYNIYIRLLYQEDCE